MADNKEPIRWFADVIGPGLMMLFFLFLVWAA